MTGPDVPASVPPRGDENKLYERVDGRYVVKASIGAHGSGLATRLAFRLMDVAEPRAGLVIPHILFQIRQRPDLQRRPEISFVSFERWPAGKKLPSTDAWDVIPDLVAEFVGSSHIAEEIPTKVRESFEAGVRRVWVIYLHESSVYEYDSPRSIKVLGRGDELEGGEVIPGFRLTLAELFEGGEQARPA